jgi:hypothetical protein
MAGSGSTRRFVRLSDMGRILLIALLLVLTVSDADARRRHRHWQHAPVMMIPPGMPMEMPRDMSRREMRRHMREVERDMPREMRRGDTLIPAGWTLQAEDPNFSGRRYMATDGSAWLALYSAPADKDKAAEHLKNVAFADGEQVTFIRGTRDWLAVSGLKGDRVYYRKAALSCGGTLWRHIAFEYPAEQKPMLDRVVERAAQAFDRLAEDSCGGDLFTHPKG